MRPGSLRLLVRLHSAALALGRDRQVAAGNRLVLGAITRGDAEEAERILYGHIRRTRLELAKHPEVFP